VWELIPHVSVRAENTRSPKAATVFVKRANEMAVHISFMAATDLWVNAMICGTESSIKVCLVCKFWRVAKFDLRCYAQEAKGKVWAVDSSR
jgi:hypothetical protein